MPKTQKLGEIEPFALVVIAYIRTVRTRYPVAAHGIRAAGVMALVRYGARPRSVWPLYICSVRQRASLLRLSSTSPRGKRVRLRNQSTSSTHSSPLVVAHRRRRPISADELTSPSLSPRPRLFLSSNNLPRQPALVWSARAPVASIASKARMWGRAPSASPAGPFPFATPDEHPAKNPSLHFLSTFCRLAAGLRLDAL